MKYREVIVLWVLLSFSDVYAISDDAMFNNILLNVQKDATNAPPKKLVNPPNNDPYYARLTLRESDSYNAHVEKCLKAAALPKVNDSTKVLLIIELNRDRSVASVKPLGRKYSKDDKVYVLVDSAISAITQCGPFQNLLTEDFEIWHNRVISLDPRKF